MIPVLHRRLKHPLHRATERKAHLKTLIAKTAIQFSEKLRGRWAGDVRACMQDWPRGRRLEGS
jgi:predicted metal-dependent HD superfamily phosphohydrolase